MHTVSRNPLRSIGRAFAALVAFVAANLVGAASALAGGGGGGGASTYTAVASLSDFLVDIQNVITGPIGTAIAVIAIAAVGIYIMYARQTGQAVGAVAKIVVGVILIFAGVQLVTELTGAAF